MRHAIRTRGFTIAELMVSLALMTSLLGMVWSALSTGQSAFNTSEGYLLASQDGRKGLQEIHQDLERAFTYSYFDGTGIQPTYVKFKRLMPVPFLVDPQGNPAWDTAMRMYIWCPRGTASGGVGAHNVCAQIQGPNGFQPQARQLLLVRAGNAAGTGNANGENNAVWWLERVVVGTLQNPDPAAGPNPAPGDARGLSVLVSRTNGVPGPIVEADVSCGSWSPGLSEACVNCNGNAFGYGFNSDIRLQLAVDLVVRARAPGGFGRVVRAPAFSSKVKLKNVQDMP